MIKALIGVILITASQVVFAGEACKKQVFHHFCLGGDITTELEDNPPIRTRKKGSMKFYLFKIDGNLVGLKEYDGKVMSVLEQIGNPSWMVYLDYKAKLTEQYGEPKDGSFFPDSADTPETRKTAIEVKKGKALSTWELDGWKIDLAWAGRKSISLGYTDTEIRKEFDKSNRVER